MSPANPRHLLPVLAVLALLVAAALPVMAQETEPSPVPDACVEPEASFEPVTETALSMPEEFRIALFDGVWEGIRELYVDPDTNGLD